VSVNWFAKKLGAPQPPQQSRQEPYRPVPGNSQVPPPDTSKNDRYEDWSQALADPTVWEGKGQAAKHEHDRCPGCGSNNYFSRNFTEGGAPRRGPAPTPSCFDCGYPTVQYGSDLGEGGSIQSAGGGR
jgi:hypothetical protein